MSSVPTPSICQRCGKSYTRTSSRGKYCGECRIEKSREWKHNTYTNNRAHYDEKNKQWAKEHRAQVSARNRQWNKEHPEHKLIHHARHRAKKRNLPFDLKPSDITIPARCPYLGIPLEQGVGHVSAGSPTLDRINPSLGYVRDNVQVISSKANLMKQNATQEELATFAKNILRLEDPLVIEPEPPEDTED